MQVNELAAWRLLAARTNEIGVMRISGLFDSEPDRLDYLSAEAVGLYVDLSKSLVSKQIFELLVALAKERCLEDAIVGLFRGDRVNGTENRPALHTLLREPTPEIEEPDQAERREQIARMRKQVNGFCDRFSRGGLTGHDGTRIHDIVSIGIGGSHLGPELVCDALRNEISPDVNVHFVANVDGGNLHRVLVNLDPSSTFFIVASKSFATAETLLNARTARDWIVTAFNNPAAIKTHFAAVTANQTGAMTFGIEKHNIFPMWDWVGGRYSLWSAIGLPIAIALGTSVFERLLAGAHSMDEHFRNTELRKNIPVMHALVALWHNNFCDYNSLCVVPYDDRLRLLPAFLQQLEMESNGKRITFDNELTEYDTAPVIWGGVGSNAQHAFFQQLHQGTRHAPVEFIVALTHPQSGDEHHSSLIANCFAQSEALMLGSNDDSSTDKADPESDLNLAAHRNSPGNRPSSTIVMKALTPESLGALLALYEHKTFVQGVIWNINSFDQWGVELGKSLAGTMLNEIRSGEHGHHDPSTLALLARLKDART